MSVFRGVIDFVMTGDTTRLVFSGIAIAVVIAVILFLRRRLRMFDPLEPPREK
jgi:hypothetical protein